MINKLNPGARQISASGWNDIRAAVQNIAPGQNTIPPNARNPFLITIRNTTGGALDPLSVVKIASPTYSRTSDTFANKGIEFGTELNGSTPDSESNNVAIIQGACPTDGFIKAIADGCTPAFIYKDDDKKYEYAKPVSSQTGYLKGTDEPTNIRILWLAVGTGKKEAFVCLDAAGSGEPLRVASKMVNTDTRPEGAFYLDTEDTWLYADSIDSFGTEDDSNPPAIVNPCGYPIDRPVIVGKCTGFNGITEEESSVSTPSQESENTGNSSNSGSTSNSDSPAPEAVAIACDVREFFMINNGSSSTSITDGSDNNLDEDYSYGALEYISYDSTTKRWTPYTGSDAYKYRLAVCQRDLPANWSKEFRMPYYTPEQNYGAEPWTANDGQSSASSSEQFEERCGVEPGDHEFTNKRLDYHYVNGRYSYEPRFIYIGEAKAGSGSYGVAIEIEGNDYAVDFPTPRSATSVPDVYAGDQITVEVDATGAEPVLTAIDYPQDFAEDTVILTHYGKPGRGWEDVTDTKNSGDLGNSDILVWDKANSKIIAEWTTHQCTCSGGAPSSDSGSSGGGGHTCEHGRITVAETTAKWWKKVKTDGQNSALL